MADRKLGRRLRLPKVVLRDDVRIPQNRTLVEDRPDRDQKMAMTRITTEEIERIADRLDGLSAPFFNKDAADALRALAAGRDALDRALRKATWDLANFTFRGKDTSLGEEAERQYRAALGEEDR